MKQNNRDNKATEEFIEIEFLSSSNINIINENLKLTIFGHDKLLADVSATPIVIAEKKIKSLPAKVKIKIPKNPENIIIPKVSDIKNATYYLIVKWDNNKNGIEDKGDIVIDFKKAWPKLILDNKTIQKIYLKGI